MIRASQWLAIVLLVFAGCSRSTPMAPAPIALDLTGPWSGVAGEPGSGTAARLNWTASQSGSVAAGPGFVVKAVANVNIAGTFTATLTGSQMTLTFSAPRGAVSGFPNCVVTGAGSATATTASITGTFTLALTSCEGLDLDPLVNAPLRLTKQ